MEREEGKVSLGEKRVGVIVTGILLFIAIVIIVGCVEQVSGETDFDKITPNNPSTWVNDIKWVVNSLEDNGQALTPQYILDILTNTAGHKPSPEDAAKIFKAIMDTKPSALLGENPRVKEIFAELWKATDSVIAKDTFTKLDSVNQIKLFNNLDSDGRINLWDKLAWKDSLNLWKNFKSDEDKTKFWNELRDGLYSEPVGSRDNRLPRNLEFLQGVLTGKTVLERNDFDKPTMDALQGLDIKSLVSREVSDALGTKSTDYSNLMKFFDKLYFKELVDKGVKGNEVIKKFFDSISDANNKKAIDLKKDLITKMFNDKTNPQLSKLNVYRIFNSFDFKSDSELRAFIASKIMDEASSKKGRNGEGKLVDIKGQGGEQIKIIKIDGLNFVTMDDKGNFVIQANKKIINPAEISVYANAMTFSDKGVSYQIKDGTGYYTLNDFSITGFVDHYNRFMLNDGKTFLGMTNAAIASGSKINFEDVKDVSGKTVQRITLDNPDKITTAGKVYFLGNDNKYYTVADGKTMGSLVFNANGPFSTENLGIVSMSSGYLKSIQDYYSAADDQRNLLTKSSGSNGIPTVTNPSYSPSDIRKDYNSKLQTFSSQTSVGTQVLYATGDKINPQGITVTDDTDEMILSADGINKVRSATVVIDKKLSDVSFIQYNNVHVGSINVVDGTNILYYGDKNYAEAQPVFKINGADIAASIVCPNCNQIHSNIENPNFQQGPTDVGGFYASINPKVQQAAIDAVTAAEGVGDKPISPVETSTGTPTTGNSGASGMPVAPVNDPSVEIMASETKEVVPAADLPVPPADVGEVKITPSPILAIQGLPGSDCTPGTEGCKDGKCGPEGCGGSTSGNSWNLNAGEWAGNPLKDYLGQILPKGFSSSSQLTVVFSGAGCGPCNRFKGDNGISGDGFSKVGNKNYVVLTDSDFGNSLGVRSYPTFITYSSAGKEISRRVGY